MDLMWRNSYGTTSVDAICDKAGAKKGSFYYFFKSKSELAAAALEADWNKKKAEMDTIFSPTVPPLERLDRYFDFVHDRLAELQKKCGSILGCPFVSVGSEVSTQDQIVRETIDRIMDRKMSYFISAVRDATAQGLIDTPDPAAKARALMGRSVVSIRMRAVWARCDRATATGPAPTSASSRRSSWRVL